MDRETLCGLPLSGGKVRLYFVELADSEILLVQFQLLLLRALAWCS